MAAPDQAIVATEVSSRAPGAAPVDILIVSLGSTGGLRVADAELADSLRRAGASVAVATALPPARRLRTLALVDLAWALASRRAAVAGLARHRPRAVIYSSTTSSLLWPAPGAIRFDAPAAGNRPGRHGLWQRPLERRRLAAAPLLLPYSEGALREVPSRPRAPARDSARSSLVLPVSIEPSCVTSSGAAAASPAAASPARDIAAITYAANPAKKGLDRVLSAWLAVRRPGEELVIAGASAEQLRHAGYALPGEGVRVTGMLAPGDYRALLRRARVFVCAPRREDYGQAQLEALADGCVLVTTPSPGPYAALSLARALDARLVGDDLGAALRSALDDPAPDYAARALTALAPFSRAAVDRVAREDLLPRLLSAARA